MIAAWYDRQGPAADVLQVGELPTAEPGPGEVRVRLTLSGANPGDIKKRQAWLGSPMAFPRIISHGDGAGVIEAASPGAATARVGRRVWVYGAQSYRPFGTAAQTTVVPEALAVDLPDALSDETGACLGIPGITAHRAVFADGPVSGQIVLVHGVRGSVSSLAAQLARRAGATVIGTVRTDAEAGQVDPATADQVISLASDPVAAIRRLAPDGVDRIVEVALSANAGLDAAVVRNGGVLAAYASPKDRPELPFWPMLFNNLTIRLLGSDDFPQSPKRRPTRCSSPTAAPGPARGSAAVAGPSRRTAHRAGQHGHGVPPHARAARDHSRGAARRTGQPAHRSDSTKIPPGWGRCRRTCGSSPPFPRWRCCHDARCWCPTAASTASRKHSPRASRWSSCRSQAISPCATPCQVLGVGRVIGPADRNAAAIRAVVRTVLGDPSHRDQARHIRDEIRELPSAAVSAELADHVLKGVERQPGCSAHNKVLITKGVPSAGADEREAPAVLAGAAGQRS